MDINIFLLIGSCILVGGTYLYFRQQATAAFKQTDDAIAQTRSQIEKVRGFKEVTTPLKHAFQSYQEARTKADDPAIKRLAKTNAKRIQADQNLEGAFNRLARAITNVDQYSTSVGS